MFGLSTTDIDIIQNAFSKHSEIEEAIVFGSRAKGTHRPGSDVDIALKTSGESDVALTVSTYLNQETNLPFFFDVIDFESIDNEALTDHIQRVGQPIYRRI